MFWVPRPRFWVWVDNRPRNRFWMSFRNEKWFLRLRIGFMEWGVHLLLWREE